MVDCEICNKEIDPMTQDYVQKPKEESELHYYERKGFRVRVEAIGECFSYAHKNCVIGNT